MITTQKAAYYTGSDIRVVNNKHPHYNAIGKVLCAENTPLGFGLKIKRFDTQQVFFVFDELDLKITRR